MKRYWKIVMICLITFISIGTFYVQSSLVANKDKDIQFAFNKVSGNENEVNNLKIYSHYQVGSRIHSLQITSKETINLDNQPFFKKGVSETLDATIEELITRYRNFMRGKVRTPCYFYEDEQLLAYANLKGNNFFQQSTNNFTFDIEVLNKKSQITTSMQVEVPEKEKYGWMLVEDVQVINGELKVITKAFKKVGGNELRVYTFDLNKKKLVNDITIISNATADKGGSDVRIVNDSTIFSNATVDNGGSDVRIVNDTNSIQPQKYLLMKKETFEFNQVEGQRLVASETILYNIETNESKKFAVPDEVISSMELSTVFNSILFIKSRTEKGLEVNSYDIEKQEWGNKLTFDFDPTRAPEAPYIKLMNGKLYVTHPTNNGHAISISDLLTGKSLYEGQLKAKTQIKEQKDYRLYFDNIVDIH